MPAPRNPSCVCKLSSAKNQSSACPWLATLSAHLTVPELAWLRFVARRTARLPGTAISWPTGWLGGLALAAVLGAIVVALRFRRLRTLMAAALVGVFVVDAGQICAGISRLVCWFVVV